MFLLEERSLKILKGSWVIHNFLSHFLFGYQARQNDLSPSPTMPQYTKRSEIIFSIPFWEEKSLRVKIKESWGIYNFSSWSFWIPNKKERFISSILCNSLNQAKEIQSFSISSSFRPSLLLLTSQTNHLMFVALIIFVYIEIRKMQS